MNLPRHTILEYIRKGGKRKGGQKIGVLLAIRTDTGYSIGYSMCHRTDLKNNGNVLDINHAISLAIGRAVQGEIEILNGRPYEINIPRTIREKISAFVNRCDRYYRRGQYVPGGDAEAVPGKAAPCGIAIEVPIDPQAPRSASQMLPSTLEEHTKRRHGSERRAESREQKQDS